MKNRAELYESKLLAVPKRSANFRQIPNNINNFQSRSELGSEKLSLLTVNRDSRRGDAINHSQPLSQSEYTKTSVPDPVNSSFPKQSNSQREHCLVESKKLVASEEKTAMITAISIATPSATKKFLKRLKESPQDDDERNVKLLKFLQNSSPRHANH